MNIGLSRAEWFNRARLARDAARREPSGTTAVASRNLEGSAMPILEDAVLVARVRATMGELLQRAEELEGLAQTPDGFCG